MKELYIAPEAEIICFAPIEELADSWNWSDNPVSFMSSGNSNATVEIEIPEATNPTQDGEMGP